MNPQRFDTGLSPHDHAVLFDAAKRRAAELRDAAMCDFWRAVGRHVRSIGAALEASARRTALTLGGHRRCDPR